MATKETIASHVEQWKQQAQQVQQRAADLARQQQELLQQLSMLQGAIQASELFLHDGVDPETPGVETEPDLVGEADKVETEDA